MQHTKWWRHDNNNLPPSAIDYSQQRQPHIMPITADVEIHSPMESLNQEPNAEVTTSNDICYQVNNDVTSLDNN